ncbi:MAG: hypothetical protein Q7J10_08760 [Methanosarcinaceae archaeon]|nr:hypothetical protein [Methanosarcinaceae archaeon]
MNIIICEGKYDAIFFDELSKENTQKYIMYDVDFKKLQKCMGRSLDYFKVAYPLIIYGDGGKPKIYKALEKAVGLTLGKSKDNIYISLILDDDGNEYDDLEVKVKDILDSLSKNKDRFSRPPTFEQNNRGFILKYPKSEGSTIVSLFTVPLNLEIQVAKKCIENKPHPHINVDANPHLAIDFLADNHYDGNKELLFRETSLLLKNEIWANAILNQMNSG